MNALRADGHDVERTVDVRALGPGTSDDQVYAHAVADTRVLVTKNGADFAQIIDSEDPPSHAGVLVIHYCQDGTDLPIPTIVRAVANIAATYETTQGMMLDVNQHVW